MVQFIIYIRFQFLIRKCVHFMDSVLSSEIGSKNCTISKPFLPKNVVSFVMYVPESAPKLGSKSGLGFECRNCAASPPRTVSLPSDFVIRPNRLRHMFQCRGLGEGNDVAHYCTQCANFAAACSRAAHASTRPLHALNQPRTRAASRSHAAVAHGSQKPRSSDMRAPTTSAPDDWRRLLTRFRSVASGNTALVLRVQPVWLAVRRRATHRSRATQLALHTPTAPCGADVARRGRAQRCTGDLANA